MAPTMDEQTMRTIIGIQRQKIAELDWRNTQLEAEVIRLSSQASEETDEHGAPSA